MTALGVSGPVLLAPMAGITDLPFRRIVSRFGAGLVVSEMVASQEMVQGKPGVRERAALGLGEGGTCVQIAGRSAHWMAEAARKLEGSGAQIIDINMGCPAKKVTNGLSGSALMRDPDHALSLIAAVIRAVSLPVTLKMRLGWDSGSITAPEIARRGASLGIRMITVHGRTRCQFYNGNADWAAIGDVVRAVDIPVIANGDIVDARTARSALDASGAAGVMVGRGAQGRPWVLSQIAADLDGRPVPRSLSGRRLADLAEDHLEAALSFHGRALGSRVIRKHLKWYLAEAGVPEDQTRAAMKTGCPNAAIRILRDLPEESLAA